MCVLSDRMYLHLSWLSGAHYEDANQDAVPHAPSKNPTVLSASTFCIEMKVPKTRYTEQCGVIQIKQRLHSNEVAKYYTNGLELKKESGEVWCFLWWM